jgi:hypothetical protein
MQAALYVALLGVSFLTGVVGHEAAHWLAWRLLGREARWVDLTTVVSEYRGPPDHVDTVAATAPLVLGTSLLVASLTEGLLVTIPAAAGLVVYTSRADLELARAGLTDGR